MPCPKRDGMASFRSVSGNHRRWMCSRASVMAASNRMIGNLRATAQDGLRHGLAHVGREIVQLRGVIPGERGAVVAMIDVAHAARGRVHTLEHDRGLRLVVVVVFQVDLGARIFGQVLVREGVHGKGRLDRAEMNHSGCSMTHRESIPM